MLQETCFGDYRVELRGVDSKNEMKEILSRCKNGFIELEKYESYGEYFVLTWHFHNDKKMFGVGVHSNDAGSPPKIVLHHDDNKLMLFCNNRLFVLCLNDGQVYFSYMSDSTIYDTSLHKNTIVVISELSIVQLKRNGETLISHTLDDVLESFEFVCETLFCKTMRSSISYELIEEIT